MLGAEWTQLQNGAEIRGVASDGIIGEKVNLTSEKVSALGKGFVRWLWELRGKHPLHIAVGMDCRLTGPKFMEDLEQSITEMGCDVMNCDLTSTPSLQMITKPSLETLEKWPDLQADGAIMITATGTHLSFNVNGLKFFTGGRDIVQEDLVQIMEFAAEGYSGKEPPGTVHITNLPAIYSAELRKIVYEALPSQDGHKPLEGLKIIVDAGNGSGTFFVYRVLRHLGADVSDSQFLNPDGRFPNHVSSPDDYEAMRSLSSAVTSKKADLGIMFDSDVDRVGIVDSDGRCITRNELVAMATAMVLEEHPGTTIVTDSITSTGLGIFITEVMGGKHHRYQRGYRNVIAEAKRLNASGEPCWLAIETSGHAAFKENSFSDDGAYFATKIVIKLAQLKQQNKSISTLIEKLPLPQESIEYRLDIMDSDFSRVANETIVALRQFVLQIPGWEEETRNYEGLRIRCTNEYEKGWFHIRQSLHDPVMPLNIESDIAGGTESIVKKLKLFFRNIRNVDSTQLYNN